uniref:Uncharacterized protein n=1 Tax=Cyprinus carpio TaxID=7962 RepID=A0A8C1KMT2_CYPCA
IGIVFDSFFFNRLVIEFSHSCVHGPFVKGEQAKNFLRLRKQSGYWDPKNAQNQWGYTIQEQANEYWTDLRTNAQYYMDMGNLVFDRSLAERVA